MASGRWIANDAAGTSPAAEAVAGEGGNVGTIKVVLAEDQALMRDAVRLVVEETEDMELAGEVADGRDLLPLLKRVRADVILLDVQLPGLDGLGCLEALAEQRIDAKVAMLTAIDDAQVVEAAFRRGADSYILKSVNPFDLPGAIRQMLDGSVIHRSPAAAADGTATPRAAGLSEKEVVVLVELCHGYTNKQIAARLWLSEQTVKFHLRNVYRKLGIKSRTEALRYAYDHDLVALAAPAA